MVAHGGYYDLARPLLVNQAVGEPPKQQTPLVTIKGCADSRILLDQVDRVFDIPIEGSSELDRL
jgi:hypothetical protein